MHGLLAIGAVTADELLERLQELGTCRWSDRPSGACGPCRRPRVPRRVAHRRRRSVRSARADPVHVVDGVDPTHGVQDAVEVRRVAISNTNRLSASRSDDVDTVADRMFTWWSVRTRVTSLSSPRPVEGLDLDLHEEDRLRRRGPLDLDHPVGLVHERLHVRARGLVHRDALAASVEPDDLVASTGCSTSRASPGCPGAADEHAACRCCAAAGWSPAAEGEFGFVGLRSVLDVGRGPSR